MQGYSRISHRDSYSSVRLPKTLHHCVFFFFFSLTHVDMAALPTSARVAVSHFPLLPGFDRCTARLSRRGTVILRPLAVASLSLRRTQTMERPRSTAGSRAELLSIAPLGAQSFLQYGQQRCVAALVVAQPPLSRVGIPSVSSQLTAAPPIATEPAELSKQQHHSASSHLLTSRLREPPENRERRATNDERCSAKQRK